ncbi:MAG: hypothetical protein QNJ85_03570 [Gammaproteobacteria bacterium]|nr:hypothetical protein [Gammaproteobacteria bacterium]
MSDDIKFGAREESDITDATGGKTITDFTQVASCAVGDRGHERIRISLREKLEQEKNERRQELEKTFTQSFRNLLKGF